MEIVKSFKQLIMLSCITLIGQAHAASIGVYNFADDAVADQLLSASGQFTNDGGSNWYYSSSSNNNWLTAPSGGEWTSSTAPTDVSDTGANTYLGVYSNTSGSLDLGFSQTSIINGTGDDLAFFFLWNQTNSNAQVTINNTTVDLNLSNVLDNAGEQQYAQGVNWQGEQQFNVLFMAATIDLSDFGYATDALLNESLNINLTSGSGINDFMALSLVAGLNSTNNVAAVPLPPALILFLSGITGLALFRRKK